MAESKPQISDYIQVEGKTVLLYPLLSHSNTSLWTWRQTVLWEDWANHASEQMKSWRVCPLSLNVPIPVGDLEIIMNFGWFCTISFSLAAILNHSAAFSDHETPTQLVFGGFWRKPADLLGTEAQHLLLFSRSSTAFGIAARTAVS